MVVSASECRSEGHGFKSSHVEFFTSNSSYKCTCVCACMRACVHACVHACMSVCMCARMHACMHVCVGTAVGPVERLAPYSCPSSISQTDLWQCTWKRLQVPQCLGLVTTGIVTRCLPCDHQDSDKMHDLWPLSSSLKLKWTSITSSHVILIHHT